YVHLLLKHNQIQKNFFLVVLIFFQALLRTGVRLLEYCSKNESSIDSIYHIWTKKKYREKPKAATLALNIVHIVEPSKIRVYLWVIYYKMNKIQKVDLLALHCKRQIG